MHWNGWHMGGMWIFWLVLLVTVVWLVVYLARAATGRGPAAPMQGGRESPEEILKKRYARGEIDRAEYEKKLEDLRR